MKCMFISISPLVFLCILSFYLLLNLIFRSKITNKLRYNKRIHSQETYECGHACEMDLRHCDTDLVKSQWGLDT
jgi:hypothetical protein